MSSVDKESAQAEPARAIPCVATVGEVREASQRWKQAGERIAFVPTMGNLHAGHLALVTAANEQAAHTVVSLFVNPAQFGENEDFADYPRTFDDDMHKLSNYDVDLVFAPELKQLYPSGVRTGCYVDVPLLGGVLEGEHRPDFFSGVATVVNKLFNIVQPDIALFGEKDYQQLLVIRQMVRDLMMPVDIQAISTVREPDGLAMSSRNAYLSEDQRKVASGLHDCLENLVYAVTIGTDISYAVIHASQHLQAQGFIVDYVVIRCQQDLAVPETTDKALVALAAVRLGDTRLIDNIPFELKPQST